MDHHVAEMGSFIKKLLDGKIVKSGNGFFTIQEKEEYEGFLNGELKEMARINLTDERNFQLTRHWSEHRNWQPIYYLDEERDLL